MIIIIFVIVFKYCMLYSARGVTLFILYSQGGIRRKPVHRRPQLL